jgi:hypothetical protein
MAGYGDLVYASGLMQCYKRGKLYQAGRVVHHLDPPVTRGTGKFPLGARRHPRRCKLQISSNFDPLSPPPIQDPWPAGTITIKIFHKR